MDWGALSVFIFVLYFGRKVANGLVELKLIGDDRFKHLQEENEQLRMTIKELKFKQEDMSERALYWVDRIDELSGRVTKLEDEAEAEK